MILLIDISNIVVEILLNVSINWNTLTFLKTMISPLDRTYIEANYFIFIIFHLVDVKQINTEK